MYCLLYWLLEKVRCFIWLSSFPGQIHELENKLTASHVRLEGLSAAAGQTIQQPITRSGSFILPINTELNCLLQSIAWTKLRDNRMNSGTTTQVSCTLTHVKADGALEDPTHWPNIQDITVIHPGSKIRFYLFYLSAAVEKARLNWSASGVWDLCLTFVVS